MKMLNGGLTKKEFEQFKYLWLEKCASKKELSEKFLINFFEVNYNIKCIKISKNEFLEKEAEIADFLNNYKTRGKVPRQIKKLADKRKRRLEESYDG